MKKVFLFTLIITLSLCMSACSRNDNIKKTLSVQINSPQQFENVMENYLYNKDNDALTAITIYLSESPILNNEKAISPITGFYMGTYNEFPDRYKSLKKLKHSKNMKLIFKLVDAYSPETEAILNNNLNKEPKPAYLDLLWGYFYATGDKRVLKKMCEYRNQEEDYIIKGAADWSYKSNQKRFSNIITECK